MWKKPITRKIIIIIVLPIARTAYWITLQRNLKSSVIFLTVFHVQSIYHYLSFIIIRHRISIQLHIFLQCGLENKIKVKMCLKKFFKCIFICVYFAYLHIYTYFAYLHIYTYFAYLHILCIFAYFVPIYIFLHILNNFMYFILISILY